MTFQMIHCASLINKKTNFNIIWTRKFCLLQSFNQDIAEKDESFILKVGSE
jgi:hypothetical protein